MNLKMQYRQYSTIFYTNMLSHINTCTMRLSLTRTAPCVEPHQGAVHKVRHAIFGQFWHPLPMSHFVTHLWPPIKYITSRNTP